MQLSVLRTQLDLTQSNKMKAHGRHVYRYIYLKTIYAMQLGAGLENPCVAPLL